MRWMLPLQLRPARRDVGDGGGEGDAAGEGDDRLAMTGYGGGGVGPWKGRKKDRKLNNEQGLRDLGSNECPDLKYVRRTIRYKNGKKNPYLELNKSPRCKIRVVLSQPTKARKSH